MATYPGWSLILKYLISQNAQDITGLFLILEYFVSRNAQDILRTLWSIKFQSRGILGCLGTCILVPSLSCHGTSWDIPIRLNCPLYVLIVFSFLEFSFVGMSQDIPRHPKVRTTALWSQIFHVLGCRGIFHVPGHPRISLWQRSSTLL